MRAAKPLHCILLGLALTASSGLALAQSDIYVYRDESGVLNFTNIRSHDRRDTLVEVKKYRSAGPRASKVTYSPGRQISAPLRAMEPPAHLDSIVTRAAADYQVDKALVHAIIQAESAFNDRAISAKGASGLMQLMPATAQRFGVRNVFDPTQNVTGGVRYMRALLEQFRFDIRLALAAYNAGENAVLRYGGIPPYPETTNYVNKVMQLHTLYRNRG